MEFLKAQSKYIAQHLRGMSASQMVAIALMLVLLLVSMWWMISWGGKAEWTDLLRQSATAEEIQQVEAQLQQAGIDTKVQGDRILIRGDEDERRRIHSMLAQKDALPKDMSLGYAALVEQDNVWESNQKSRWKQYRALETELSTVLAGFRGLSHARVMIVVPERRTMRRASSMSSASVNVTLIGGGALNKQLVMAIANYVAGAVPGLAVQNVKITDGSRVYRAPDDSDGLATNLLELQREREKHYTRKIYDQLGYIKGVVVNVHAKLRQNDEQTVEKTLGPPMPDLTKEKTEETTGGSTAAGPGVRPNTGRKLADTSQGAKSNKSEITEQLQGERDRLDKQTVKKAGSLEKLTASVSVPSSYLLRILAMQQPNTTDPSRSDLQAIADVELPKIKDQVEPLVVIGGGGDKDSKLVVVDWYYDLPAEEPVAAAAAPVEALALFKSYGPQAGLALLATFSLFMVFRIARKAQLAVAGTGAFAATAGGGDEEKGPLERLASGAAAVGEVQEMEGVLVGHEVDESMVRTQQIVSQIGDMVKQDPSAAANIVEHWLQEEE